MKKGYLILAAAALLVEAMATGCGSRQYDDCEDSRRVGSWGVVSKSMDFGGNDSIYFLVNPIRNYNDSIYFNGNYNDTYFREDSTRVSMAIGPSDSLRFYIRRMYAVQVNPPEIIARVKAVGDTAKDDRCTLRLKRIGKMDNLYLADYDSTFLSLVREGRILHFTAVNGPLSTASEGSQNYTWILDMKDFTRAVALRDNLNDSIRKGVKPKTGLNKGIKNHLKPTHSDKK